MCALFRIVCVQVAMDAVVKPPGRNEPSYDLYDKVISVVFLQGGLDFKHWRPCSNTHGVNLL